MTVALSLVSLVALLILIGVLGAFTAIETRRIEARYPPRGARVEIGGGTIHVLDRPAEGEERGAVLMLHGASGNAADFWIQYGQAKYGFKLALGVTGVMASDYYPYLQSGQIFGLLPGVKGAAEYEQLLGKPAAGSASMPYQVTAHVVILAFMILSNIGYIAQRRARAAGR